MSEDKQDQEVTLRDFIEENHKLLSALGILVALVAFASNLRLNGLSVWLSFLFLGMAVLVLWELMVAFPRGRACERLRWFGNMLVLVLLGLLVHWFVSFRPLWRGLLWIPAMLGLTWLLPAFRWHEQRRLRWLAAILTLVVLLLVAYAFVETRPMPQGLLWVPVVLLLLWLLPALATQLARLGWFPTNEDARSKTREWLGVTVILMVAFILLVAVIKATTIAEPFLYRLLESLYATFEGSFAK